MESPDLLEMLYYSVFDGEAHGDVIELDRQGHPHRGAGQAHPLVACSVADQEADQIAGMEARSAAHIGYPLGCFFQALDREQRTTTGSTMGVLDP
ncbi:hypothetical protein IB60_10970 [Brucella abortus LMN1]|uniref:Uncharacterized protein n=2 Tax=Brucella TaxID=234 RepID=A9M5I6_BRUC2|nr:Hypothetical protein, conserved [Brucella canis ATCC 23365]ABY38272.1 Hypothetical protein, conserved [Brucella suis ATCC 23445]EXU83183.1 hypothetical protein AX23_07915 [Brucella melitensis 548]KFH20369.1 hypothetical protein IB60_10970 [Brucella abortus LMN1]KFH21022.1 hypothetical protein IB61_16035 [Brucella abortus LMN2]